MNMINFNSFLDTIILENLHPELQEIVRNKTNKAKQTQLANKIKDLTERGEKTGIEGNMPKGSSRAYLQHEEPEHVTIDGKKHKLKVGTKVAIRSGLDSHHNKEEHDGHSLGQMQNKAENSDWFTDHHRILTKDHDTGEYHTNHDSGIFPPLLDHDEEEHHWSRVGHVNNISKAEFKKHTKTESHPQGISHEDFCDALERFHNRNNGRHWGESKEREKHLDHIDEHPLVQKFQDYHGNTGNPPNDYRQIKNLGLFHHPDGTKHIVARDHGFDTEVQHAYKTARQKLSRR